MSTPPTSSHRRTFDFPKSSPDAGLAEWTSKIKAIQQEVDRDEEVEQRRLQDEITHSRMERARRRNTATGSIDWSMPAKRAMSPSSETSEDKKSVADGQQHQSDALRKLVGSTSPSRSPRNAPEDSMAITIPHGSKSESISLAAFIGGRATGPKLNKPAPQRDSHDPTLFDQTRRKGPHPVFGRTNGAMMAGEHVASLVTPENSTVRALGHENKRDQVDLNSGKNIGSSSQEVHGSIRVVRTPPEVAAKPVIHPKPLNRTARSLDATLGANPSTPEVPAKPVMYRKSSTPALYTPDTTQDPGPSSQVQTPPKIPLKPIMYRDKFQDMVPSPSEPSRSQSPAVPSKPSSLTEMIGGQAIVPPFNKGTFRGDVGGSVAAPTSSHEGLGMQGRALSGMGGIISSSPPQTRTTNTASPSLKSKPLQSSFQHGHPSSSENSNPNLSPKRSLSGSNVATPSLARPVQPQVVVHPSPVAAASTTVSPAFLRTPPSTQDLHPSLSRLQGRGFVEKRIKASTDIYGGSNTQMRERSTSAGASGRRPTVLDRWQPTVAQPASPSTSPPPGKPTNKGKTAETTEILDVSRLTSLQQVIRPRTTSPGLGKVRPSKFDDAKQEPTPAVRLPGMASPTSLPPRQWVKRHPSNGERAADERTFVVNDASERSVGRTESAPLSHPTRDRVRRPRKIQRSSVPHTKSPQPKTPDQVSVVEPRRVSGYGHVDDTPRTERANMIDSESERVPSPETRGQPSIPVESNISKLRDELTYHVPMKTNFVIRTSDSMALNSMNSAVTPSKRALPRVTAPPPISSGALRPITPTSPISSPEEAPLSPSRHSRIPSTGHRATVMDVAQALQEHEQHIRESSLTPEPDAMEITETRPLSDIDVQPEEVPQTDVKAAISGWGRSIGSGIQLAERRRSVYDRYSVVTLPPLAEEKTPAPTPQGSLSRSFAKPENPASGAHGTPQSLQQDWASVEDAAVGGALETPMVTEGDSEAPKESVPDIPVETAISPTVVNADEEQEIRIEHHDEPPPGFNLQSLLRETPYSPDAHTQTISVEVLSISGYTAAAITREPNVFYDSEVVTVVHRAKEKAVGLVSTNIWTWRGRNAELGEKEERKVIELTERFGTKGTHCAQGSEPHELIHVLGGVLAIRQGKRVHWTVENTAMHRIHRIGDSIFVDEIDLAIDNLCSAYSYCLSVLDTLYVWHGRGSSEDERKVASAYGQSLATRSIKLAEFEEGAEDEMFWMLLGDDCFANASHWKFKSQMDRFGSRLYTIDSTRHKTPVQNKPIFSGRDLPDDGVFVVDCRFELFIVVTPPARGKRRDIQLALFLAENISAAAANKRPFDPPVHVVILPSKLPLELQTAIRLCDGTTLNGGSVPDHMNLLPLSEAVYHMQRRSWPISTLSDINFLPLGVDPRML